MTAVFGTETLLLSIDRERADVRMALRRAFLTGRPVRTDLIQHSAPVQVIDYTEKWVDGRYEIAVAVVEPDGAAGDD